VPRVCQTLALSLPDAPEDRYELLPNPSKSSAGHRAQATTNAQVLFLLNNASDTGWNFCTMRYASPKNGMASQGEDLWSVFRLRGRGASCGSVVIERLERELAAIQEIDISSRNRSRI
jgi:hypothetical protein